MRENRLSGSEGGATLVQSSLPLSFIESLRDKQIPNRSLKTANAPPSFPAFPRDPGAATARAPQSSAAPRCSGRRISVVLGRAHRCHVASFDRCR
jgi:hypothetical protein